MELLCINRFQSVAQKLGYSFILLAKAFVYSDLQRHLGALYDIDPSEIFLVAIEEAIIDRSALSTIRDYLRNIIFDSRDLSRIIKLRRILIEALVMLNRNVVISNEAEFRGFL